MCFNKIPLYSVGISWKLHLRMRCTVRWGQGRVIAVSNLVSAMPANNMRRASVLSNARSVDTQPASKTWRWTRAGVSMDRQVSSNFTEIDLEAVAPILEGKLDRLPPISSRLVRVFVSSTFSGRSQAISCPVKACTFSWLALYRLGHIIAPSIWSLMAIAGPHSIHSQPVSPSFIIITRKLILNSWMYCLHQRCNHIFQSHLVTFDE